MDEGNHVYYIDFYPHFTVYSCDVDRMLRMHVPSKDLCLVQPFAFHFHRAMSMETGLDLPCPKSFSSYAAFRFSADITLVLTRIMERTVVHAFVYPTIQKCSSSLTFHDQFAFRPTGSTTAAITTLLHEVTHLLLTNPCVVRPSTWYDITP